MKVTKDFKVTIEFGREDGVEMTMTEKMFPPQLRFPDISPVSSSNPCVGFSGVK